VHTVSSINYLNILVLPEHFTLLSVSRFRCIVIASYLTCPISSLFEVEEITLDYIIRVNYPPNVLRSVALGISKGKVRLLWKSSFACYQHFPCYLLRQQDKIEC